MLPSKELHKRNKLRKMRRMTNQKNWKKKHESRMKKNKQVQDEETRLNKIRMKNAKIH